MSNPGFRALVWLGLAAVTALLPATALPDDRCDLSQTRFDFPEVRVNLGGATGFMTVANGFDEPLEINPTIDSEHFSTGGLHIWLEPGQYANLVINFHPQTLGYFETVMDMGNDLCSSVLLTGTGIGISCAVEPSILEFGVVQLGESATRSVTLFNDGDLAIPIDPGSLSPVVAVLGGPGELLPGESTDIQVIFSPDGPGAFTGVVDWGAWYPACAGVHFTGEGAVDMEPGQNRVGVFFDEEYTELVHRNDGTAEFLTGYLVLTDPAPAAAVAGWELLPAIEGPAYITQWDIPGEFVDAGLGDQLIIGLGEPLPWADDILLATCRIYVAESVDELISVELKPVWNPSIAGRMAWLPAGGQGDLQVMLPFTGVDKVAWIRTGALSPTLEITPFAGTAISANVPNPFNPSTEIRFTVGQGGPASLRIYDLQGRLVRTLLEENLAPGPLARVWNGRDDAGRQAPSGAYYVRLMAAGEAASRKIMLLK